MTRIALASMWSRHVRWGKAHACRESVSFNKLIWNVVGFCIARAVHHRRCSPSEAINKIYIVVYMEFVAYKPTSYQICPPSTDQRQNINANERHSKHGRYMILGAKNVYSYIKPEKGTKI